jgi:hypothetical protein
LERRIRQETRSKVNPSSMDSHDLSISTFLLWLSFIPTLNESIFDALNWGTLLFWKFVRLCLKYKLFRMLLGFYLKDSVYIHFLIKI